jgi:hypothetical protein
LGKVLLSPFSDVLEDGGLVLLEGVSGSGEGEGDKLTGGFSTSDFLEGGLLVGGEKGPGAVVEEVSVELSLVVVESEGSSVDSDDVSDSVNDGQIFESLGEEDEGGEVAVFSGSLGVLDVKTLVDDLEGTDVSVVGGLVGEGGVNNDGVEVLGFSSD